jgi:hypothetical protein
MTILALFLVGNTLNVKPSAVFRIEISSLTSDLGNGLHGTNEGSKDCQEHGDSGKGSHDVARIRYQGMIRKRKPGFQWRWTEGAKKKAAVQQSKPLSKY